MIKTFAFTSIATLMASPACAGEDVAMVDFDANADGFLTIEEVQGYRPGVSQRSFADWDVSGDAQFSQADSRHRKNGVGRRWQAGRERGGRHSRLGP